MTSKASDTRSRTVAPTTLRSFTNALNTSATNDAEAVKSEEYLDKMEEELNRKVDADVDVLVEGMAELVKMAKLDGKDHFRVAQEAFQAECRTESMIRAAHSLLSLSHSLKLLHLFADTATTTTVRDAASKKLEEEIAEARETIRRIVEGQDDMTNDEDEDADMEEV